MNVRLNFRVGRKRYRMWDFEAEQLYSRLSEYFESIGAMENMTNAEGKRIELSDCEGNREVKGFRREQ